MATQKKEKQIKGINYLNEILKEPSRHTPGRPDKGQLHQFPELVRCLWQQNAGSLIQIGNPEQTIFHVNLLQANPSTTKNNLLHHVREVSSHTVPYKPTIADPHQAHFVHPMSLHHLHHALRLKGLAPLRSRREGLAEEHKVWHVHVEVPHEVPNVFPVLPHRIGAKTVNKYETWLAWLVHFGYPAMHDGSFAEVGGHRPEPRGGEQMTVQPVPRSGEADAF